VKDPRFGTVSRECRAGERMRISRDGVELGVVEVVHVPFDGKVRIDFTFDKSIRLIREVVQ
jgi:hypothetical protein